MAYATIQDFRDFTGITTTDIPDNIVQEFIDEANIAIRADGYVKFVREPVTPTITPSGEKRYYLPKKYLADGNLDGNIDKSDLQVFEYDAYDIVDISAQIDKWDETGQYFTLNDGYPTAGRAVCVTYYAAADTLTAISDFLKKATMYYAASLSLQKLGIKKFKKGIVGMSVEGLSLTRSPEAVNVFNEMISGDKNAPPGQANVKPQGYWKYINYIKPAVFVKAKIGGAIAPETIQIGRAFY